MVSALGDDHLIKSLTNGATKQLLSLLNDYKFPRPVDDGAEPWFLFNNSIEIHQPLRKLPQFDNSLHEAGWF